MLLLLCAFLSLSCATSQTEAEYDPLQPIHHAALKGKKDEVLKYLNEGVEVDVEIFIPPQNTGVQCPKCKRNTFVFNGSTPLHLASGKLNYYHVRLASGNEELVRVLLEKGAQIHKTRRDGWTALHYASNDGNAKIVSLLLEKGANPNAMMEEVNATPLHFAVYKGHLSVVKLLLENGANVNTKKQGGLTAVYEASLKGYVDIVKILVENGADFTIPTDEGANAFHAAVIGGRIPVVKYLVEEKGADVNMKRNDNAFPIHDASLTGSVELVALLLENGAETSINEKTTEGVSPVWAAFISKHVPVVKLLLDNGAQMDVNIGGNFKNILKASQQMNFDEMTQVLTRLERKEMKDWDKDDVSYWVSLLEQENKVKQKKCFKLFRKEELDGKKILEITEEGLKNLGIEEKDASNIIAERERINKKGTLTRAFLNEGLASKLVEGAFGVFNNIQNMIF